MTSLPRSLALLLPPLIPIGFGAVVMRANAVASGLWMQNLGAGAAGLILGAMMVARGAGLARRARVVLLLAAALIAATLLLDGTSGVHRWIPLASLRVHAAFLGLPVTLAALYGILRTPAAKWAVAASLVLQGVLVAQPDASQSTALAAAFFVAAAGSELTRTTRALAALAHGVLAVVAWTRPDSLAPVDYVEGIVGMAGRHGGVVWAVLGIVTLALIPLPFLLVLRSRAAARRRAGPGLAMAVYWSVLLLAGLLGTYPVPLMGFGASPILGFFLSLGAAASYSDASP